MTENSKTFFFVAMLLVCLLALFVSVAMLVKNLQKIDQEQENTGVTPPTTAPTTQKEEPEETQGEMLLRAQILFWKVRHTVELEHPVTYEEEYCNDGGECIPCSEISGARDYCDP